MGCGGSSEGAARGELRDILRLLWDPRRERLVGAAGPGACWTAKGHCSAGRGVERLPAAPGDAAEGGARIPWVSTAPQLPAGCSGMGQMSSCSLEGDSIMPDQDGTLTSSFSHLFAV